MRFVNHNFPPHPHAFQIQKTSGAQLSAWAPGEERMLTVLGMHHPLLEGDKPLVKLRLAQGICRRQSPFLHLASAQYLNPKLWE